MFRIGEFKLCIQHDKIAYYAEVGVTISIEVGCTELRVEFEDGVEKSWRIGAAFGLAYAFEKLPLQMTHNHCFTVRVTHLRGHLVDTTEVTMAYVSAKAFWQAIEFTPRRELTMVPESGTFIFPK